MESSEEPVDGQVRRMFNVSFIKVASEPSPQLKPGNCSRLRFPPSISNLPLINISWFHFVSVTVLSHKQQKLCKSKFTRAAGVQRTKEASDKA